MVKYVQTTYNLIPTYLRSTDLYRKFSALNNIESSSLLVNEFPEEVTDLDIESVILAIDDWGFVSQDLDPTIEDVLLKNANKSIGILSCNFLSDRLYFKVVNILLKGGVPFQRVAENLREECLPLGYKDIILDTMCIYSKETLYRRANDPKVFRLFNSMCKLVSLLYTYYKNNNFELYDGVEKITNTGDLFDKIRVLVEIVHVLKKPFFYMKENQFNETPLTLEEHILHCIITSSRPFTGYESGIIQIVRSPQMPQSIELIPDEHNKLEHIRNLYI